MQVNELTAGSGMCNKGEDGASCKAAEREAAAEVGDGGMTPPERR